MRFNPFSEQTYANKFPLNDPLSLDTCIRSKLRNVFSVNEENKQLKETT